jgi:hypothetical protein
MVTKANVVEFSTAYFVGHCLWEVSLIYTLKKSQPDLFDLNGPF